MKKIILAMCMGVLIFSSFACTPENLIDETEDKFACCGDDLPVPPPPPPGEGN